MDLEGIPARLPRGHAEIGKGYIRPSLLHELGIRGSLVGNKEELQQIDDQNEFEPHKNLYERHARQKIARIEYERSLDPENYNKIIYKEAFREFYRHPIKFFLKRKYLKHLERLQ